MTPGGPLSRPCFFATYITHSPRGCGKFCFGGLGAKILLKDLFGAKNGRFWEKGFWKTAFLICNFREFELSCEFFQ